MMTIALRHGINEKQQKPLSTTAAKNANRAARGNTRSSSASRKHLENIAKKQ